MTPPNLLDLATLQNLVELDDGGTGLLSEMIEIFREDTPRRLRAILAAADQGHAEELSRAGHALKGGAGALGADALRRLAAEVEALGRTGSAVLEPNVRERLQATFQASLEALEAYVAARRKP